MEQNTSLHHPSLSSTASNERDLKWKERSILEAIRAKGYERDEILVRSEQRS